MLLGKGIVYCMNIVLTLDIRLWKTGTQERIFSATDLRKQYQQLKKDEQLLQAMIIDNFRCGLSVDGKVVSHCTFMFNGESSPDLMYFYEQHLPALYEGKAVKIEFFEELVAWQLTPQGNFMDIEVSETIQGQSKVKFKQSGNCDQLSFINAAINWLTELIAILELYQEDTKQAGNNETPQQIEMASKLLAFSKNTLAKLGWK